MRLVLHKNVYSDIGEIRDYYQRTVIPGLADDFYQELRHFMAKAAEKRPILRNQSPLNEFAVLLWPARRLILFPTTL